MAEQLFLSADGRLRDTWRTAFPAARAQRPAEPLVGDVLVWVLVAPGEKAARQIAALRQRGVAQPLIVLADEPGEDDALAALTAGASGYCNSHAAPEVLSQVATVVGNGGLWVGQGLMQRLLAGAARLLPPNPSDGWADTLTEREREVAHAIARGASNKEVARELAITERTVKAHVGAILEKLGARDRLQLSLIVNGVESSR
ncbi:response regulator transcription factor [Thauera aminoaromatica]|uniref:Response regulator transcription factor n=1 Tax=Thauera aminoaromatica TaxID=164330 RepID=A0A5C7S0T3_THASP|nr:response regulator transcription factor [Thauera aminoaromatica]TXH77528.1 MAG: response regulator transcription factor [Thauera aminoaromatica]